MQLFGSRAVDFRPHQPLGLRMTKWRKLGTLWTFAPSALARTLELS